MIGKTVSHYRILEKLGEGGMGIVYKAEDIKLERIVALKFLPPHLSNLEAEKKRFIQEAKAASALEHNNICAIHEINETDDGQLFIAMSYLEGKTLREKIDASPVKVDEAIGIAIQAAEGLKLAHEKGIVHRDIKPANIMITTNGTVKIMDFGLAKLGGKTKLTQMGTTLGTFAYMSPEQSRGEEVDRRTDIWSLGVVMYEMLTGQLPFKGDYEQAVIYSIKNENPEPVTSLRSGMPMELERIINKALSKKTDSRYQNISDMIVDLSVLKNKSTSNSVSQPSERKLFSKVKSKKWLFPVSVIIVVAFIITAYFYFNKISGGNETLSTKEKIVVLPFKNLGPQDEDYFAEGITDEITSKLSYIGSIGVISKNSAEKLSKLNKSTEEIGEELGVSYILSGTIRWAKSGANGSRVRITPQLTRVSDNTITWSDTYDKVLNDIFAIQSDIAQQVVDKLGTSLHTNQTVENTPPTNNLSAYDYYLQGLSYYKRGGYLRSDTEMSISLFNKARELDSTFAQAYANLSSSKSRMYFFYYDRSIKNIQEAFNDAQKAYQLNPNLAEVHLALGFYYYWCKLEYEKAIKEFSQTLKIQPNNTESYFGIGLVYRRTGEFNLAIKSFLTGISLDPLSIPYNVSLAETYGLIRDYKNADKYFKRVIELNPESSAFKVKLAQNYINWKGDIKTTLAIISKVKDYSYLDILHNLPVYLDVLDRKYDIAIKKMDELNREYEVDQLRFTPKYQELALIYKYKNEPDLSKAYFDSSRIELQKMLKDNPHDERLHSSLGITYAGLGERDKAIFEGRKGIELLPLEKDAFKGYYREWDLAIIYILLGDYYNALKQIDFILSVPGAFSVNQLKLDPLYNPLRSLSEYKVIISKYSATQ